MSVDPTACAERSGNALTDELPSNGPYSPHDPAWALALPCRYCGHGSCLPGVACQLCRFEIRLQALERKQQLGDPYLNQSGGGI
jgi:hypothetical protein